MWQSFVKLVQAVIFFGVIIACLGSTHEDAPRGLALVVFAGLVVMVVTVIPWLIWNAVQQFFSKPARVDAVFPEALDHRIPSSRILGNIRPRIGKRSIDI